MIAPRVLAAVIHHTATPNGYASAQVAGIIRSLYLYQTRGNGLADLAFNYLVDAQGRVYEGRYGGIDQNVVGSHTAGLQHRHRRRRADRQLLEERAAGQAGAGARHACWPGGSTSRTSTRSRA